MGLTGLLGAAASAQIPVQGPGSAPAERVVGVASQALGQAPEANIIEGRVVQASSGRLILKDASSGERATLWLRSGSPVVFGGVRRGVRDLGPGMDVHAAYREVGKQREAVAIQLQPLAPGQASYSQASSGGAASAR